VKECALCEFQLSEVPSGSGGETSELNGLIEAATGSPIYVTSASELASSSQSSALHRTPGTLGGGGGGELQADSPKLLNASQPDSRRPSSSSSSLRGTNNNNVTVVGINTTTNRGEDDNEDSLSSSGHPVKRLSNGQYPDTAKKSPSKESVE